MPHQVVFAKGHRGRKRNKVNRPLIFLHCGIFAAKESVFRELRSRGIIPHDCASSTLRKYWMLEFWNVKIKSWQPFAKCEDCITFRAKLLTTTDTEGLTFLRLNQRHHRLRISIGRRRYDVREKLSKEHKDLFLHVSIDAMDNKKTNIPQTRHFTHTKSTAGGERLKTRIMGEYDHILTNSLRLQTFITFTRAPPHSLKHRPTLEVCSLRDVDSSDTGRFRTIARPST